MEGNTLINCRQPCGDPDCLDSCVYTREGKILMDELRKTVFQMLRRGEPIMQILYYFQRLEEELITMKDYAKAIEEADRAP
jgi:hypothetical protein